MALAQSSFQRQRSICLAELRGNDPKTQINLRSGPSIDTENVGYGVPGDLVYLLSKNPPETDVATDNQGNNWYRVGFPASGASGWIRADFLVRYCAYD
jgi:hypothetical protein